MSILAIDIVILQWKINVDSCNNNFANADDCHNGILGSQYILDEFYNQNFHGRIHDPT